MTRTWLWLAIVLVLPGALSAQSIRGRVLNARREPIIGALVELRETGGKSVQIVLTSSSGGFQMNAPSPGRYLYRVAAIGFQPRDPTTLDVPAAGVIIADVVLTAMTMRLPDLVALGNGKYCSKGTLSGDLFSRVLESAHSALQIMETSVATHQATYQVAVITTATLYGSFANISVADTAVQQLSRWPVASIEPDTLRAFGFGRTLDPGNESTREYYGPDARVLFSDWFLASHCFSIDKPKKNASLDSLHVRFEPSKKSKLIDVAGDLVLDAHNLSLLQFSFSLRNLPNWMSDDAAGGYMEFARLNSGLWVTKSWAIWAPRAGIGGGRITTAGLLEKYGWVTKVYTAKDTIIMTPRDTTH